MRWWIVPPASVQVPCLTVARSTITSTRWTTPEGVGHPEDPPLVIVGFLLERQGDGQEIIHRRPIRYGDDRAIDALKPGCLAEALRRVDDRLAGIAVAFHQMLVGDAAGMCEDRAISTRSA